MPMLRVAIAQVNQTVGALEANASSLTAYATEAERRGAQCLICPELCVPGYPPEDLVFKPSFVEANLATLRRMAATVATMPVLVGFVDREGDDLFDAAAVLHRGKIAAVYRKMLLPNYGVFDEKRYFSPGSKGLVLDAGDTKIGVTICEDIWPDQGPYLSEVRQGGATVIVNLSASPYHRGKWRERRDLIARRARESGAALVYANMVGGQDDLVFDGFSLVADATGQILAQGRGFAEQLLVVDLPVPDLTGAAAGERITVVPVILPMPPETPSDVVAAQAPACEEAEVYDALVLATRDYVRKNGFANVIIGLSGGIDSALVAAIATDAVGPANVHCLFMPSRFTSEASREDASAVAANLGIDMKTLSIDDAVAAYQRTLEPFFRGLPEDITEENIQARVRGNLLMAFSNKRGYLVLTTGNKSEMACGYATLYGDMAGGFAVIKDVLKTMVFRLVAYRNRVAGGVVLPERLLTKAPSAELRPDQRDSDSLPPYEVLDPILERYVERDQSVEDIVGAGYPRELVRRVARLVDRSEYKRRQSPPGVRITVKAFGRDRRLPITNGFSDNSG